MIKWYANKDSNNNVISQSRNEGDCLWYESEGWQPEKELQDENGCYLYRIENGEIRDTTDEEKAEQLIPQCRAKLNASTKNEIAQGCEYEGKILPITDDWEAKYLAMEKSYADGNTDSITIDTLDNTDTFTFTPDNIEVVTDVLFQYKMSKVLTCQALKRDLVNKSYDELLEILNG